MKIFLFLIAFNNRCSSVSRFALLTLLAENESLKLFGVFVLKTISIVSLFVGRRFFFSPPEKSVFIVYQ